MPPSYSPGGHVYGGEFPGAFMPGWPPGGIVVGRMRGGGVSIWAGTEGVGLRTRRQTGPEDPCDYDTTFNCLLSHSSTNVLCPDNGPTIAGNVISLGLPDSLTYDRELLGFNVSAITFSIAGPFGWSGGAIGPFTAFDGSLEITWPENGPDPTVNSNLADAAGGSLVMFRFPGSDGIPLYVAVVFGAQGIGGLNPAAPGWDLVQRGTYIHSFIFTGVPGGGGGGTTPGGDVVTDICERAGLDATQIDVSLLQTAGYIQPSPLVMGFVCERPTPASQLLKVLMGTYLFEGVEEDGVMRWIPRGLAPKLTIPEADLGLEEDKAKIKPETFAQAHDLSSRYAVLYNDPTKDYQQGRQSKNRNTRIIRTKQQTVYSVPMTMTPDWARQVAEKRLYLEWLERQGFTKRLWRGLYMKLSPTDVIEFVYEGLTFRERIVEENIGQGFATELVGVNDNTNNYLSSATGGSSFGGGGGGLGGGPKQTGPTTLFLLDIPLVTDGDSNPSGTGAYAAMSSAVAGWPGAILENSADDSAFFTVPGATSQTQADYGYSTTVLGVPRSPWTWDNVNTLTVRMLVGTPESNTALAILNGSNVALAGGELIQYTTAIDNGDGTFTLSGLLRGRRGTEWAISSHALNEPVILMPAGVVRFAENLSIVGQALWWAAVTVGGDITGAAVQQITLTGADRKPYAPAHLNGSRSSGDLTINWTRRTRLGGAWADGSGTVPVSEDTESYQIDILNGSNVVRTITVEALASNSIAVQPTALYTAAQQTTDFGSPQTSIALKVYQVSGEVGRGFAASATV